MADAKFPANIREFNEITGVVFAQLYAAFPINKDIEPNEIATALGRALDEKLESGTIFNQMLAYTMAWLVSQGFILPGGSHPRERAVLTDKALATMNAVPASLGGSSYGTQIADAAKDAASAEGRRKLADIVGSFIGSAAGSFVKSASSG